MDLLEFYSRSFNVSYARSLVPCSLNATIKIETRSTKNVKIILLPTIPDNPTTLESENILVWEEAFDVELSPTKGIIFGKLGGKFYGREFCISPKSSLQAIDADQKIKIHCYLEKWHVITDGGVPTSQDDGEWHGTGN
ncbi:hypothetical protein [Marinicella sp. W31]|uniref:hypothetical protein n=1 Tax=Marinicella sp. W31 TaxID=3023713 RepID=UPI0037568804